MLVGKDGARSLPTFFIRRWDFGGVVEGTSAKDKVSVECECCHPVRVVFQCMKKFTLWKV